MEQVYTPTEDNKVLVMCMTYNQSKYIEDALNGFVMQKTDFPFTCLVMDDASTDGEQEVISSWMGQECNMEKAQYVDLELSNVVIVPHKVNASCSFAFYLLKQNLFKTGKKNPLINEWKERCKYVALCEGDDYWTDPDKLQKQVDFLEKNDDYGFIGCKCKVLQNEKTRSDLNFFEGKVFPVNNGVELLGDVFEYAINGPVSRTCTILYRASIVNNFPYTNCGDLTLEAILAHESLFARLESESCIYRIHDKGLSHPKTVIQQLNYHRWYEANKRLLSKMFPDRCKFDKKEMEDRRLYILLKDAIYHFRYAEACKIKKTLQTSKYQHKKYSKFLSNPISFFVLSIALRIKNR